MPWAELENACIAALAAHKRPAGPFATVKSYDGELAEDALGEAAGLLPAAFVLVKGGKLASVTSSRKKWREELTVSVMVANASPLGNQAVRQGTRASQDLGLYALVQMVLIALTDLDVEDFARLAPGAHHVVTRTRGLSAHAIEFETKRILDLPELQRSADAPVADLLRIDSSFDVNGDELPEAEDLVELEEPS